jgi:hypothetical protein
MYCQRANSRTGIGLQDIDEKANSSPHLANVAIIVI